MFVGNFFLAAAGPIPAIIAIAVFVAIVSAIVFATRRADASRRNAFAAEFAKLNMSGNTAPTVDEKNTAFARFPVLHKQLLHGSKAVQWFAELAGGTPPTFLCEHMYVVSTGKSSHRVYHTIACVAAPTSWATTAITRESVFTKIGKVFGLKDLDLENPAFNSAWRVRASDENFALALITPELQALLADTGTALRGEGWMIGGGTVCLMLDRAIKPDELANMHSRLMQFVSALAPELQSQINASRSHVMVSRPE